MFINNLMLKRQAKFVHIIKAAHPKSTPILTYFLTSLALFH
ncbi:hypothetical protein CCP3SC1AL1_1170022 [Gammaproteobacteria bacterium]